MMVMTIVMILMTMTMIMIVKRLSLMTFMVIIDIHIAGVLDAVFVH